MNTNDPSMNKAKRSNRLTLIALLVLFTTPVLLSVLMHSDWWQHRPSATRNHGELLQPPVAVADWPDTSAAQDGQPPVWTLLLTSNADCAAACQEQLTWLRQIRTAQGRHAEQVAIQLAASQSLPPNQQNAIREISADIATADAAHRASLHAALSQAPAMASPLTTYLIDPAGFIILRYAQDSEPGGIRKDLSRLLTWSNKSRN